MESEDATSANGVPTSKPVEAKVFSLKENGNPSSQWTLTIQPSHLSLADAPGAQPYAILREQFKKEVVFMEGMRAFSVKTPRNIIFRLSPEAADALADWLGKPFLAAFYMKRRYAWLMPWAILWVVGAIMLFLPANAGRPKPEPDYISLALGLTLLVSCIFAKWRPHPILFLVDGTWFAIVTIRWAIMIVFHERSSWWLIFLALLAWMSLTGYRHFFRFRGVKLEPVR